MRLFRQLLKLSVTLEIRVSDCVNFCAAGLSNRVAVAGENLFLRKQLALFSGAREESGTDNAADRFVLSNLVRFFAFERQCTFDESVHEQTDDSHLRR